MAIKTVKKNALATSGAPLHIGTEGESTIVRLRNAHDESRPDVTIGLTSSANSDMGEPNQVLSWGHNRAGTGGRQDENYHSWHVGLEREFYTGSVRQAEFYIQYVSADGAETVRPISSHIDTSTHLADVGFFTERLDAKDSPGDHQFWVLNKSGQEVVKSTNEDAYIGVHHDDATETFPTAGAIRMTKSCNIVGRRGATQVTFTQLTASPNMILGSTGNACGMYVDAGSGQAINLRPNAASATWAFSSTHMTCPLPIGLWSRTVAELGSVTPTAGRLVYCSNGDAGSPCLAVGNGTNWLRVALGAAVSAT